MAESFLLVCGDFVLEFISNQDIACLLHSATISSGISQEMRVTDFLSSFIFFCILVKLSTLGRKNIT